MKIVFDLDGTLFFNNDIESVCFIEACRDVLRIDADSNWGRHAIVTDLGIFRGLAIECLGRKPFPEEERSFVEHYTFLLSTTLSRTSEAYRETVPGAREMLAAARTRGRIGIATGNLRKIAALKIQACDLDIQGIPMVAAEDGRDRSDLVRRCLELLGPEDVKAVSVGDGVWDVKAAREVGIAFVGVGTTKEAAELLRRAGAETVIADFAALDDFWQLLETATVPTSLEGSGTTIKFDS